MLTDVTQKAVLRFLIAHTLHLVSSRDVSLPALRHVTCRSICWVPMIAFRLSLNRKWTTA